MSTFNFEIKNSTVVEVVKDGFGTYKPRSMSVTVSGDNILLQTGIDVDYDFIIASTDDIIFRSAYVTGTVSDVAAYLEANIFNVTSSAVQADEPVILTGGSLSVALDQPASTYSWVENYDSDGKAEVGIFADTAALSLYAYGSGDATYPNLAEIRAGGASKLKITVNGGEIFSIPGGALVNYADDTAAATGGVPVNGLYRTGSAFKIRVA